MYYLNEIKSKFVLKIIVDHIKTRRALNIFKYSKCYQSKLEINKNSYLINFFDNIPLFIEDYICSYRHRFAWFEELLEYTPKNISKEIIIKDIVQYCIYKDDVILSLDNDYFYEIIKEKKALIKSKLSILINLREFLSQNDIIDMINSKKSNKDIEKYIKEKIELYNEFFKKIEILENDFIIGRIDFEFDEGDIESISTIDYDKDIIEYKDNQTEEEKNILISIKLKRAELLNKLLIKNYKNINKMKLVLLNKEINKKIIFPLIDLNKFNNLISLDLYVLLKTNHESFKYEFNYDIKNLRELKIGISKHNNNYELSNLYIKKDILDKLDTLKIRYANFFVLNNEYFHFKNIKKLDVECIFATKNEFDNNKKYFFEELLKGNIKFEKLEKLKLSIPYTQDKINNKYINEQIVNFIDIANLREMYDSPESEFFPKIFKFIFENQVMNLKNNNQKNINIKEFKIKLHDDYRRWVDGYTSGFLETTKYSKKDKDVKVYIRGSLYGIGRFNNWVGAPIKLINFDNIKIDQNLDSFLVDGLTIEELNIIKNYILSLDNEFKNSIREYKEILKKSKKDNNIKECKNRCVTELKEKIEKIRTNIKYNPNKKVNRINLPEIEELSYIQKSFIEYGIRQIEKLSK